MPSVFSLFDILGLIYLFRSVQLGLQIWREWGSIRSEPFNAHKKQMANQASYFIAVPIGVLIHEFSHAVAVWLSGGQVAEFHYRAFWGYVVPQGNFTPAQTWFIAVAGTVGSLLFGVAIWLLLRHASSTTLRYFGLRAFRFQVYFSLIYYPVFTLLGFNGDWRTIYDFSATPILSAVTAVSHLGILFYFWRGDRSGWFEYPSYETMQEQEAFETLAAEVPLNPYNSELQVQYIDDLRRGGAQNKAKHQLKQFLAQNPDSAIGYLELAAVSSAGKAQISKKAAQNAELALKLGLANPQQNIYAHEIAGRYQLEIDQIDAALRHFTQAIEILAGQKERLALDQLIQLHILRSQAYRRHQNYELSYQDILEALSLAQKTGSEFRIRQAEQELETLESHTGRSYGASPMKIP